MQRREYLKAGLAVLGLATLGSGGLSTSRAAGAAAAGISRQLRFTVTLTNPKSHELRNQTLWLYGPAETPAQTLEALSVSMSHELRSDRLGHRVVGLAFPEVPPLASRMVRLVADVRLLPAPPPTPLAAPEDWLGAERFIEVGDPGIQALAGELRRPAARDTARAIYDWLRRNLRYAGYLADDWGAREALTRRRGDCTEYACLAVALARANGIPARMVGGYVVARPGVLRAADYHNWAEVYLDGAWRLLDAQQERWMAAPEPYVAFRIYRDRPLNPVGLAHRFRIEGELAVGG